MKKATMEINAGNWTGKTVKVNVRETKTGYSFDLYDYTFKLTIISHKMDGLKYQTAKVTSDKWDGVITAGARLEKDKTWMFSAGDITREDQSPITAAVQVLCNII